MAKNIKCAITYFEIFVLESYNFNKKHKKVLCLNFEMVRKISEDHIPMLSDCFQTNSRFFVSNNLVGIS